MKDIYCKIADWIVSQNIDRAVNSTDIKEIADYVFNVQLKSTGVLKVKECLREKGITVKDALKMTPLDYIKEALDKEGIEYEINDDIYGFNPPYYASINILDPNDIDLADEIICNIVGYAYQVHRDRYGHKSSFSVATEQEDIDEINGTSLNDKKFKDEKYIVYLNGEPYYTAKSYDEATRIESQLYSASDTEDDFQAYYGNYPDVEIRKVRDSKIKDSKPTLWGAKAYDVEKECWRGFCKYIDTESGKEASKILENEVPFPYSKYRFLGSYYKLPEHFIRLDDSNIKDSKLTRKQKMWYGEELENLIYPQYLRRNYQKRKARRKKK